MITVTVNSVDVTSQIEQGTLEVTQKITYQRDVAIFRVRKAGSKTFTPAYSDDIEINDGSTKIFGGKIVSVQTTPVSGVDGIYYEVRCADHSYEMDNTLAAKTYENTTIEDIIDDLITSYASTFTTNNVNSTFTIEKVVFNQISLSTCIKRLADVLNYDWYVDEDKDVHFFPKNQNVAPFNVSDTNGNYIYGSLRRISDGSEVVNRIKVRGGEYNGATYTDRITVSGSESKSFKLPYRFANLTVTLDPDGTPDSQTVGADFIDDFTSKDVLHNFQEQMIRFETVLTDGDVIEYSGNPKVPVFAISEDPVSVAQYGKIEKLIRDDAIESNSIARRRANAELYAFSEPIIDAQFRTYESGLRAGQIITVQSDIQGINDELIIKDLKFSMRDHTNFMYEVSLVSTRRYDFVSLLQKILEPDPRVGDQQETSEEIFTDTQIITIEEETEVVSAFEDISQQVEVQEAYLIDPLGDETNATYVLAPYTPTSQSDTKRIGRLNISLTVV